MGCVLTVRDALTGRDDVQEAAVDYDKGLVYVVPKGTFDAAGAIAAIEAAGDYKATVR